MKRTLLFMGLGVAGLAAAGLIWTGLNPAGGTSKSNGDRAAAKAPNRTTMAAPAVSVIKAEMADFAETVLVTGSIVPREEIMVAPEIEGFRVLELIADEGQAVTKGDVLARVEQETLDAQLAQNTAQLARSNAAIAQAHSGIAQAEARLQESKAQFDRAKPLKQSGYLSESTFDQRESAARTAEAQLISARDGLKLAESDKGVVEAQRRELAFRRGRTEIRAPADGIVSRRNARIGSMATAIGDPMFRLISNGEFELDAEVPETRIGKLMIGQLARIEVAGVGEVTGTLRLVSPEVDRISRLGRVRIFVGKNPALKLGLFGRGNIETRKSRGLAVPASAILYSEQSASLQIVIDGKVQTRRIETGLISGGLVEVRSGIAESDTIVARAGSFLRDGDIVRTVAPDPKLSEATK
ncbi:MAG: efflux transporter periplasmic adaptor subunit [Hyphomicrobium sp.]|nr:MAG: efflux transporter periplasmic adaptor subunit [Hyphomicrobium sp.]